MHDFEWFVEHLEIARYNSTTDFHAACPVCGGSDPLHVTEKNGKALVTCFSCGADYSKVVEQLETEPTTEVVAPDITRHRRKAHGVTESASTPRVDDPIAWYALYCGVDEGWLRTLPVRATADGWVAHYWPGTIVTKDRKPNSGDRRWSPAGAANPRLWPEVTDVLPVEVWLCEGETDCIVLRAAGLQHVYTAGSASSPLTVDEMRSLKRRGVERVVVAYDSDKPGQKARDETVKAAREAEMGASVASLGDPLTGCFKDWRDRWVSGEKSIPKVSSAGTNYDVWSLDDVEAATDKDLLLGRLHPLDHTILFGDGGTGKGVIAAWWVSRLTKVHDNDRLPMNVLVLDYEQHATHEWRPRVEAFKGNLKRVWIVQPSVPIWDMAGDVRTMCEEYAIDYVVIDSVTYACAGTEVEKSSTAALYTLAIAQFKKPVLSLAHTTKIDDNPKHPFGSIFWSNGARVTIAISTKGYDEPRLLVNKKTNQAAPFKSVQVPWDWVDTGLPTELKELPNSKTLTERIYDVLLTAPAPMAQSQIRLALSNDGEGTWTDSGVGKALHELSLSNIELLPGKVWALKALKP